MAKQKLDVLVSPEGNREWTPEDAAQATNLRARGWTPKVEEDPEADKADAAAPKTTTK
ncbi:hypothetical protein ACVWY0_003191 [Arthrobacter sp. UYNi723]